MKSIGPILLILLFVTGNPQAGHAQTTAVIDTIVYFDSSEEIGSVFFKRNDTPGNTHMLQNNIYVEVDTDEGRRMIVCDTSGGITEDYFGIFNWAGDEKSIIPAAYLHARTDIQNPGSTIKMDRYNEGSGSVAWSYELTRSLLSDRVQSDTYLEFAVDEGMSIYVYGEMQNFNTSTNYSSSPSYLVAKVSYYNGLQSWMQNYGTNAIPRDFFLSASAYSYITGSNGTVVFNYHGSLLHDLNVNGYKIIADNQNDFYIASTLLKWGWCNENYAYAVLNIIKYNSNGDLQWTYESEADQQDHEPLLMQFDESGI